ncbi:unnamed protein product [Gongylonema pulchrum]|uniref:BED-type domain-containing protein n=1 Tax=Gongylonema pulchrum TaxID=637853 RepID=A0A183CUB8_9BILA|nr:unnamed protein product [Gongylonema pulchrum]
MKIGKRRSEYVSSDAAGQYVQEDGCSVPKMTRNDDSVESSEHLISVRDDVVYHSSGAEVVVRNENGEEQTLSDISRCAPPGIAYERPQSAIHSDHCKVHQQHCSVQPQCCDVQELPLSNGPTDRSSSSLEIKSDVKNETCCTKDAPGLLTDLNNALNPSDAEFFDPYRSKGRPRGPKHPVWNFYKFCKSGGVTLGYMCLLCNSGFTGPPNTTNATKHLRCKHKHEHLLFSDLLEGVKRGTVLGDVHQSVRERELKAETLGSEENASEAAHSGYGAADVSDGQLFIFVLIS